MQNADLSQLKTLVSDLVKRSALAAHLQGVTLEPEALSDDSEFIRVIVQVDTLNGVSDEDLEALTNSIEEAVPTLDGRFPSVRFAEAA